MNDIQTRVEGVAMGNVYDGGLNGISNAINQFGAAVTGRQAPVGPPTTSLLNTDTLPPPEIAPNVSNIGDVYP
jgi:hypothetical protein